VSPASSSNRTLPYMLDKNAILTDLTTERPQWILSAYGPGRHAPAQLFGGLPREQSFEEMRLLHYMGLASGNPQQVVQEADSLVQQSEQQMQTAVNNIDSAIQYLINAEKEHPNRIDICKGGQEGPGAQPNPLGGSTPFGAPSNISAFGAPSQPSAFSGPSVSTGAFGQPSQLGSKPNPFGSSGPAFGAPTQLGTGAFGQPAQLGQKPSPFGAPSAGSGFSAFAGSSNTFGQPASTSAFGAPSQSAGPSNTFGQPANTSAFGAPSLPAPPNAFGAPSQPAASNAFGAPSQLATSNPFGAPSQTAAANPFAQKAPSNPSPFGAPSRPVQQNPFGNPSAAPFGAPTAAASSPFGAPTQPANPSAFGQPTPSGPSNAPFGKFLGFSNPTPAEPSATNGNAFGAPQPPNGLTNGQSSTQNADVNTYSTRDASGRLLSWKNQKVVYKDDMPGFTNQAGKWERIWFPNGTPAPDMQAYLPADKYDQNTKDQYAYVMQNGKFKDGIMPLLPPLMEMCRWDF
jgi:nucleoporin NUP42